MAVKEDLLKLLEQANYWEEDFILKYDTESNWALLRTLPKDKFKKIEALLKANLKDTVRHKQIVNDMLQDIKRGKYGL